VTITHIEPVIATVTVGVPPDRAWATFTERIGEWWPAGTHSIGESQAVDVVLEAGLDGAVREVWSDGTTHYWGRITVWEPPTRLAFWWRPSLDTSRPPTQVVVELAAVDGGTEVRLTHVGWEVLGADGAESRAAYARGWPPVLERFVEATTT
jgi:uncharacterized protein YndB with AHSA1/START domain